MGRRFLSIHPWDVVLRNDAVGWRLSGGWHTCCMACRSEAKGPLCIAPAGQRACLAGLSHPRIHLPSGQPSGSLPWQVPPVVLQRPTGPPRNSHKWSVRLSAGRASVLINNVAYGRVICCCHQSATGGTSAGVPKAVLRFPSPARLDRPGASSHALGASRCAECLRGTLPPPDARKDTSVS
jgi:hypothetical protein